MVGVSLLSAKARGADFSRANLTKADLAHANLREAKLTKATLNNANLTAAELTDADLSGAMLIDAILTDAAVTREQLSSTIRRADGLAYRPLRPSVAVTLTLALWIISALMLSSLPRTSPATRSDKPRDTQSIRSISPAAPSVRSKAVDTDIPRDQQLDEASSTRTDED
jgi:hypothetical protein